ncbi:hypothetical protein IWW34DRAFT_151186 [Fusarium oxysporum f. sp. albedinis]|nr:hypothetical protein IWW34DRAFT_151186 [Fusarium oxysporum f. sp. albedinis]
MAHIDPDWTYWTAAFFAQGLMPFSIDLCLAHATKRVAVLNAIFLFFSFFFFCLVLDWLRFGSFTSLDGNAPHF